MRNVTLLVCLSPSNTYELVTETSFFGIVNPITPVTNLKMVCGEGQLKAFVQVKNESAAVSVVNALHGRNVALGKLKVYISHKKFINYEQSLSDVLQKASQYSESNRSVDVQALTLKHGDSASTCCNQAKENNIGETNAKVRNSIFSQNKNIYDISGDVCFYDVTAAKNNGKKELPKIVLNRAGLQNSQSIVSRVSLTHINPLMLKSKLISEVFGKYGNIIKKEYDSPNFVWTLHFDSEQAALGAVNALRSAGIDWYRLVEGRAGKAQDQFSSHKITDPDIKNNDKVSHLESSRSNKTVAHFKDQQENALIKNAISTLRIEDTRQTVSAETVCRLVSQVATPLEILEACDLHAQYFFFLVKFTTVDSARQVYTWLNSYDCIVSQFRISFA